jgi:hypothetical protein
MKEIVHCLLLVGHALHGSLFTGSRTPNQILVSILSPVWGAFVSSRCQKYDDEESSPRPPDDSVVFCWAFLCPRDFAHTLFRWLIIVIIIVSSSTFATTVTTCAPPAVAMIGSEDAFSIHFTSFLFRYFGYGTLRGVDGKYHDCCSLW